MPFLLFEFTLSSTRIGSFTLDHLKEYLAFELVTPVLRRKHPFHLNCLINLLIHRLTTLIELWVSDEVVEII
ncbi:hypothetical protein DSECCO2_504440 [anaerobic digester metagenome]